MQRTLVSIESPYAGDVERNTLYARFCMRDSIINHNEAPFASHLLYTQPNILNDCIPVEREIGITTGLEFTRMTEKTVVYTDLGITKGMEQAIKSAEENGTELEMRKLSCSYWELYLRETINLNPVAPPDKVRWEGEKPAPPEMPQNRVINEDISYLKHASWIIPISLLVVIAIGIAESVGWL